MAWHLYTTEKVSIMNKIFVSLLAGIAVGILIAPAKGAESRALLISRLNGLADNLLNMRNKYFPGEDKRVWEQAFGDQRLSSHV